MRLTAFALLLCASAQSPYGYSGYSDDDFDYDYDDDDELVGGGGEGPAAQTGLDAWTDEILKSIDQKYMRDEGLDEKGELIDPTLDAQLALTEEAKEAARSLVKDLESGFSPAVLQESARDPYYFIDRTTLRYASGPVIDPGLWKALINSFYLVKKFYLEFIHEFGSRNAKVPDRLLLLKLRNVGKCKALGSGGGAAAKWQTQYLQSNAKAIAKFMPLAMAGRHLYVTNPATELARVSWDAGFGEKGTTFSFVKNPAQTARHNSIMTTGHPRLMHLGSLTFFSVLDRALYMQDQIHPYHEEMGKLYHLFLPSATDKNSRGMLAWRPSTSGAVEKALVLIARCLGELDF